MRWAPLAFVAALLGLGCGGKTENDDSGDLTGGRTGAGVTVVIIDRGIDWRNPDFINGDGTTRILWMLDMTGQDLCSASNPAPVEYSEAQINVALVGGPSIALRDAVGHGTATAGIAAGNGRAFAGGKYSGIAQGADLIIVKVTSEGAPAHGGVPAEPAFQGCMDEALDWWTPRFRCSVSPRSPSPTAASSGGPSMAPPP